jgi:hypothetical protein
MIFCIQHQTLKPQHFVKPKGPAESLSLFRDLRGFIGFLPPAPSFQKRSVFRIKLRMQGYASHVSIILVKLVYLVPSFGKLGALEMGQFFRPINIIGIISAVLQNKPVFQERFSRCHIVLFQKENIATLALFPGNPGKFFQFFGSAVFMFRQKEIILRKGIKHQLFSPESPFHRIGIPP